MKTICFNKKNIKKKITQLLSIIIITSLALAMPVVNVRAEELEIGSGNVERWWEPGTNPALDNNQYTYPRFIYSGKGSDALNMLSSHTPEEHLKAFQYNTAQINGQKAMQKARELAKLCKDDDEKCSTIIKYIKDNMTYSTNRRTYFPDLIFVRGYGACTEYSILANTMLSAVGIPSYVVAIPSYEHDIIAAYVSGEWRYIEPQTTFDDTEGLANTDVNIISFVNRALYPHRLDYNGGEIYPMATKGYDSNHHAINNYYFFTPEEMPSIPEILGYTFTGWNTSKDGTGQWVHNASDFHLLDKDVYYAQFRPSKYNVVFNLEGGILTSGEYIKQTSIEDTTCFTFSRPGYYLCFTNIRTNKDIAGCSYTEGTPIGEYLQNILYRADGEFVDGDTIYIEPVWAENYPSSPGSNGGSTPGSNGSNTSGSDGSGTPGSNGSNTSGTNGNSTPTTNPSSTGSKKDGSVNDITKVTSVSKNAFKNNKKITKVTLEKNIKKIGTSAFQGATKLKTVIIKGNLSTIGDSAFAKTTKLETVKINGTVQKIGKNAFNGSKNLKSITLNGNKIKSVGKNAFKGVKKNCKITVLAKNKTQYNKIVKMIKKSGAKNVKYIYKKKK